MMCNTIPGVPFTKWINLITPLVSNHMPNKVCNEITYPFQNFNSCTNDIWEWICNFIYQFVMDVITYPYWE